MQKKITWIVVADGARARFLRSEGWGHGLTQALDQAMVGDNRPSHEIGSDRPGRTFSSATGHPSGMEPKTDWHRFEKAQFAKEVAKAVEKAAIAGEFDRLVLVAPPQALGDLRAALGGNAQAKIVAELGKDLTHLPLHELEPRLAEITPV
jgi:protein required for attachment to host cells